MLGCTLEGNQLRHCAAEPIVRSGHHGKHKWVFTPGVLRSRDQLSVSRTHYSLSHWGSLSSQHHAEVIDDSGKPEIINFYNSTKADVDTLDQLVRFYTVQRKTRRWPLTIFFNVLDIACYNAFVLYTLKYPEFYYEFKNRSRRKFVCDKRFIFG